MIRIYSRLRLSFLIYPIVLFGSVAISAEPELEPFSNFYIQDVLQHTRKMAPTTRILPASTHAYTAQLSAEVNTDQLSLPLHIAAYLPWIVITGDALPNILYNDNAINHVDYLGETLLSTARVNLIFGHTYKFPAYFRIGYDRIPFGRHFSEVMHASTMVTQRRLNTQGIIASAGFDYTHSAGHHWRTSLSAGTKHPATAIMQYDKTSPTQWANITINRISLGGGIGFIVGETYFRPLVNIYSDIAFAKEYNWRLEYFCHTSLKALGIGTALHTEVSKSFILPRIKWHIPAVWAVGYELGDTILKHWTIKKDRTTKPEKKLFAAIKLKPWKQRITCVLGGKLNLNTTSPEPFARLHVNLL